MQCIESEHPIILFLQNPWVISLVSPILFAIAVHVIRYFSSSKRWERRRLAITRKAIVNLINRFNITCGQSASQEYCPILTIDSYKYILFESYLLINGRTGYESYPDDDTFKYEASVWYGEWESRNMADAIQYIKPYEMNNLVIEVASYGVNGKSLLYRIFPRPLRKMYFRIRNIPYKLKSKYEKINLYLYEGPALPKGKGAEIVLSMISGDSDE